MKSPPKRGGRSKHRRSSDGVLDDDHLLLRGGRCLRLPVFVRLCCNGGPSTNLLHLTLIITATVCCWMMWAIVYLAQLKPLIVPILSEGE